jgi:type II secretory pathway pseudopilin PulG
MKLKPVLIVAVIIVVVLAAILLALALRSNDEQLTELNTNQYAFVVHSIQTIATLEGSNNTTIAYQFLGYPTYNATQIAAYIQQYQALPPVNNSLKAVFQEGDTVGPSGCHGTTLNTTGIYQFPFTSNSTGLSILSVDNNGVAYIIYNGTSLIINPQENWYNNQTYTENVLTNDTSNQSVEVNVTVTDRITNYGLYDK